MVIDLNCDLGEGEPLRRTRELMKWITSANIACGGHAGNARSMEQCVIEAKRRGVKIGAHPGIFDRASFGRGIRQVSPLKLELVLLQQVSALVTIAARHGRNLHHIKMHGALYHAAETNEAIAKVYVVTVQRYWPTAAIYALADGLVARKARAAKVKVFGEAFADRRYHDSASLIDRRQRGAVLGRSAAITQAHSIVIDGFVGTSQDSRVFMRPTTICVHGDSPDAVSVARAIRGLLKRRLSGVA